jgi:hypothetical protein
MKVSFRAASGSAGHPPRNSGGSIMTRVKSGAGAPRSRRKSQQLPGVDSDHFHPVIPAQAGIRFQRTEDRKQ